LPGGRAQAPTCVAWRVGADLGKFEGVEKKPSRNTGMEIKGRGKGLCRNIRIKKYCFVEMEAMPTTSPWVGAWACLRATGPPRGVDGGVVRRSAPGGGGGGVRRGGCRRCSHPAAGLECGNSHGACGVVLPRGRHCPGPAPLGRHAIQEGEQFEMPAEWRRAGRGPGRGRGPGGRPGRPPPGGRSRGGGPPRGGAPPQIGTIRGAGERGGREGRCQRHQGGYPRPSEESWDGCDREEKSTARGRTTF